MIQLADDVFAVKNDPDQLDVNQDVLDQLRRIHPATVSEFDDGHGPVAWVLLIPTTLGLMDQSLSHSISEKEMYEQTPLDAAYEAILSLFCHGLEEYRRKGIARQLTLKAIDSIRKDHPIKICLCGHLLQKGDITADTISQITSLPLLKR
ncbi:MAG: hypothetical protein IPP25_07705 [Saprospiraceae bacterium]|nr:hypothetical protein [Candidatus Opimibacter skivensis]